MVGTWYEIVRDAFNPWELLGSCTSESYEVVDADKNKLEATFFINYWPLVFLRWFWRNPLYCHNEPDGLCEFHDEAEPTPGVGDYYILGTDNFENWFICYGCIPLTDWLYIDMMFIMGKKPQIDSQFIEDAKTLIAE